ncbi:hypothetical protein BS47DRAFT_1343728 [Hydnum rufescens UP504]|uniref:Kinetochore protein SPC25 n=1 Tax=Hydnum rufescens UP504 TaxID=1448309 RepID=A0A9P6DWM9_9AGAM|nr:hypothetical protein BS47DRAFT_1343728 [Hydnum rufescens UP504]
MGWSVESVQRDMLLFRFINVDPANPAREFSLVTDVSQKEYKGAYRHSRCRGSLTPFPVPTCTPLLPAMPDLVNTLNETGEFYTFVRNVRLAFREYALEERGT